MQLKTILTCPLGHKCQEVVDGVVNQCAWFVKLAGTNPNSGERVDEQGCAMNWLPILLVENAQTNRGTSAAVESFRNEMVKSNELGQHVLMAAMHNAVAGVEAGKLMTDGTHDTVSCAAR